MSTFCESNPDRWQDPDPKDIVARELCKLCWYRKQCATDALKSRWPVGIWAGVLMPRVPTGGHYAKNKPAYDAALQQLSEISSNPFVRKAVKTR